MTMKKTAQILIVASTVIFLSLMVTPAWSLDAPTIAAIAKGPNQINLTWPAVTNPGWGYKVEIQSDGDTRYSSWTDLTNSLINGYTYLHPWVTESNYKDRADGTGTGLGSNAQFIAFGLKYGTVYNFRVRCYGKTDAGSDVYGSYSNTASATTITPSAIYHVGSGYSWTHIYNANGVTAASPNGTLVIIHGGSYAADYLNPSNAGASASQRIVYQVNPGDTATITSIGAASAITLNTSYIVLDGLTINDSSGTSAEVISVSGSRNVIVNTALNGPAWTTGGWGPYIYGTYNLFHQNYWNSYGTTDGQNGSVYTLISGAAFNLAQYNHFAKGGHDRSMVNPNAHHNAWLNNLMDGQGGQCLCLYGSGASYNFMEGNICKNAGVGISMYKPAIQISGDNTTIRRNVIYDAISSSSDRHAFEINTQGGGGGQYSKIYNNVVYNMTSYCIDFMGGTLEQGLEIANNVFYGCQGNDLGGSGYPVPTDVLIRGTYTGTIMHNNFVLHQTSGADVPNATIIRIETESSNHDVATADSIHSSMFYSNTTTTPTFFDLTNRNFHLISTSPGIGAGTSVTDTTWGTIGVTDIGAFKYFNTGSGAISSVPDAPFSLQVL